MMEYDVDNMIDLYNEEVMNHLKILSYKIENVKSAISTFDIMDYTIEDFLTHMLPIPENKLDIVKEQIVDNNNESHTLDLILMSNELSKLIIDEHVELVKKSNSKRLVYKMDDFAVRKLNKKFGLELTGNMFSMESENDDMNNIDDIDNINDIRLN